MSANDSGEANLEHALRRLSLPLERASDLDPLLECIGDAPIVMLGEATHGTSDFYLWRAAITQRLIAEKNFSFVCVEGDWPDCYRLNRVVKGYSHADRTPEAVLGRIDRWPTWMWANWEVVSFADWLAQHNVMKKVKAGFYGLDVYSLWDSLRAISDYLERKDPAAAKAARDAFLCFEPYRDDERAYAFHTTLVPESCEDEVIELLAHARRSAERFPDDDESSLDAEQNAHIAVNAERYYRAMIRGDSDSWNIRDYHMADTLERLMAHHGKDAKAVVWAHNTHIGDARATDMIEAGMINIGQLARERHGATSVVLVGFSSYHGSVVAGRYWDAATETMEVPPAVEGSWEEILHRAGARNKMLLFGKKMPSELHRMRGHRAIGVVYHPDRERGNYVPTDLAGRYNAMLFIDRTRALHPLETARPRAEPPETYPWAA